MNVDHSGSAQLPRNKPIGSGCRRRQQAWNAALLAAGVTVWCGGASGTPSCQGTYAATSLQPLPERVVVDLDISDRSKRNLMLANRFLTGVREAGVAVGQDANVLLHVTTSRLGETPSGAVRGAERNYSELGGLAGGGSQLFISFRQFHTASQDIGRPDVRKYFLRKVPPHLAGDSRGIRMST